MLVELLPVIVVPSAAATCIRRSKAKALMLPFRIADISGCESGTPADRNAGRDLGLARQAQPDNGALDVLGQAELHRRDLWVLVGVG